MILMTKETEELIHRSYEEALEKSENIFDIFQNLYSILRDKEVASEDSETFTLFVENLKEHYCIKEDNKYVIA